MTSTPPPAIVVTIRDHTFVPNVIRVKPGQTIVFKNTDQDVHTVTSGADNTDDDRFHSSPPLAEDAVFAVRLTTPGRYPFYCKPHQYEASMHGTIVVAR